MVEPHSSNLRVITTNFLGVQIVRKFTVTDGRHPFIIPPAFLYALWVYEPRENLSSGFATRVLSNRPAQPQKLGRGLKCWI